MNPSSTPQQPTLQDLLASKREGKSTRQKNERSSTILHFGRAILLVLLLIAPWCLGSVHVLPQMLLLCGITVVLAAWWLDFAFFVKSGRGIVPYIFIPVFLGWLLAIAQLVPLSDSVAAFLAPKQQEIYSVYTADETLVQSSSSSMDSQDGETSASPKLETRYSSAPTTISMDVDRTKRFAGLLVLALGCLLTGAYFFKSLSGIKSLLSVMSFNGAMISIYGIYTKLDPPKKVLGVYEMVYGGVPFGPYVNRNNAAGFLLICMGCAIGLIYLVMQKRKSNRPKPIVSREMPAWRRFNVMFADFLAEMTIGRAFAFLFAISIACGIVSTLSRGGTIGLLAGALTTIFLFALARKPKSSLGIFLVVVVITTAAAGYLGFGEKLTERIDQFSNSEIDDIQRFQNWRDTSAAIGEFGVAGSGLGAYHAVHRMYRQDNETKLYEYAENQFFQTLIDAGWVGLALLVASLVIAALCVSHLLRHGQSTGSVTMGLVGLFTLTSVGVASVFDFGLYLAANMCAMAVVVGVMCGNAHWQAQRMKQNTILRFALPNTVTAVLGMFLFAGAIYYSMYFFRIHQVEKTMIRSPLTQNSRSLDLAETDRLIAELEPLVLKTPTARGYQQLGELHQHRYRLQLMKEFVGERKFSNTKEEQTLYDQYWRLTNLDRLHAWLCEPRVNGEEVAAANRKSQPMVKNNIPVAKEYFRRSRNRMPLQPETHMLLGYLEPVSDTPERDSIHIERATSLAPSNANLHFIAGKLHLQAGRETEACKQWQQCLQISASRYFKPVVEISIESISSDRIFTEILPRDPKTLYQFATRYLTAPDQTDVRTIVLQTVNDLLNENRDATDFAQLDMSAKVKFLLGDNEGGLEEMERAIGLRPDNHKFQYDYANKLLKFGKDEEAKAQAIILLRNDGENIRYQSLYNRANKSPVFKKSP